MNPRSLLQSWPLKRTSPDTWRAVCGSDADATAIIRSVARALAHPREAAESARELVLSGDFDATEVLLADDGFAAECGAEAVRTLEEELDHARSEHLAGVRSRLAELGERALRVDHRLDLDVLPQDWGGSRAAVEDGLLRIERDLRRREAAKVERLRRRLDEMSEEEPQEPSIEYWRAAVDRAISLGAIAVAEAALDRGPSSDLAEAVEIPPPPVWPYRGEPLRRVIGWFFDEGVIPPGFERYRPLPGDKVAAAFLDAVRPLRTKATQEAVAALADVLASRVLRMEERADGLTGYLADLSAPGLHALGMVRWPAGIPVWVSDRPADPDPEVMPGQVLVRFVMERGLHRRDRVLHLGIDEVLAVLHDARRRDRLLAHLGRQLPLDMAFQPRLADVSVRWARNDVPAITIPDQGPTLLLGAPGMGKSTLLAEMARTTGGVLVDAGMGDDLPEAPVILIDGVGGLDEASARRLVREVHWVRTMRQPPPVVVVAARPEARDQFDRFGGALFKPFALPARSFVALREQAATMLGWVGVEAHDPASYDRMALLAGGNPTVLYQLCGALVSVLTQKRGGGRGFTPTDLDCAWRSPTFRDSVRALLWEPLADREGVAETITALVDYSSPGPPLSIADLTWSVGETLGPKTEEWISARVQTLAGYGLVHVSGSDVSLAVGGLGMLAAEWIRSSEGRARGANPFLPGAALSGLGTPPGRGAEIEQILERVRRSTAGAVIIGPRRAGKTSLLRHVENKLRDDCKVRHLSLERRPCATPEELAIAIEPGVADDIKPTLALENLLREEGRLRRPVIFIDEVGCLRLGRTDVHPTVFGWLRGVGQGLANVVFAGSHEDWRQVLDRARETPGSSFGNDLMTIQIRALPRDAALEFLQETAPRDVPIRAGAAATWIVECCGTWPFYLQVMGHAVVEEVRAGRSPVLSDRGAVRDLYESVLLRGYSHLFRDRWLEIPREARRVVLSGPRGELPNYRLLSRSDRKAVRSADLHDETDGWSFDNDLPFREWLLRYWDDRSDELADVDGPSV